MRPIRPCDRPSSQAHSSPSRCCLVRAAVSYRTDLHVAEGDLWSGCSSSVTDHGTVVDKGDRWALYRGRPGGSAWLGETCGFAVTA
jgi:hypothetical protein